MTDLECGFGQIYRGLQDGARSIGDSEGILVYGMEISLLQVLRRSEGRRTMKERDL